MKRQYRITQCQMECAVLKTTGEKELLPSILTRAFYSKEEALAVATSLSAEHNKTFTVELV